MTAARRLHFVGSLPADMPDDDRAVLSWPYDHSGGHELTALPRDLDPDWIVAYLRQLAHRPAFRMVRKGGYTGYQDLTTYRVASGYTLTPDDVAMRRVQRIRQILTVFRQVRAEHPGLAGTRLQVSQPNPLDMALFVFATPAVRLGLPLWAAVRRTDTIARALRHLPVFQQAVTTEIRELHATEGHDLLWQIESPLALLGMTKAATLPGATPLAARLLSTQLAGLYRALPDSARTVLHLCYGDYGHTALLAPHSLAPAVALLNPLAGKLRADGIGLPPVHIPCGHGDQPAPTTSGFYAPLSGLRDEWPLIAGVVSDTNPTGSGVALDLFEHATGRPAHAVAAPCGLGRRSMAEAEAAAAAMAYLADPQGC